MKIADLIQTSRHVERSPYGGRPKPYYRATCGNLDATAPTRKEAEEACAETIRATAEHTGCRRYFYSPSGRTVFVVYFAYGRWGYDIMDPSRSVPCTCSMDGDFRDVCEAAKRHAADYDA